MTTIHIIQSTVEIIAILALTYAIYRLSVARNTDKPRKPRTEARGDKAVVFTGRDFFSADLD